MTVEIFPEEEDDTKEKEEVEKLINDFNKLAKEKKSKYRIRVYFAEPQLVQLQLGFFHNYENQIVYHMLDDKFSFYNNFTKSQFEELKEILEALPQKFVVKIKEEKNDN